MGVRLQEANGCKSCGAALSGRRLDLGRLPACNRFLSRNVGSDTHPLVMAECPSCGLVQLAICPPPKFVMPRVPWIRYREPEAHLDDVVARLMPSLPPSARALGVGPFDGPLMERLGGRGFGHDLLDLIQGDASGGPGCYPYLETVQARLPALNPATVGSGAVDLVVCRYLLEHSHDPVAALLGLKCLLAPTGKLLIEVPDCEKFLSRCDYSFIWEEHICYFSETTLRRVAAQAGFRILQLMRYAGALEDALVAVLEYSGQTIGSTTAAEASFSPFGAYMENFANVREAWHARLRGLIAGGRRIALIGVGHQAIMFVNALGLQNYISRVADDLVAKQGHFPPGIAAPIVSSTTLAADPAVGSWLLAISPPAQTQMRTKFAPLIERGLRMYSIFAESSPLETSAQ